MCSKSGTMRISLYLCNKSKCWPASSVGSDTKLWAANLCPHRLQEFEFLSIEQETSPKKAISNKRVWKTSKEWNTPIFISGYQKCKVAIQDVISVISWDIPGIEYIHIYSFNLRKTCDHQSRTSYKNPSFSDQFCNTSSKLKFHCSIRSILSENYPALKRTVI